MRKLLLFFLILTFFTNKSLSQSKSETEQFILLNLKSIGLEQILFDSSFYYRTSTVRFFQNYFIIKEEFNRIINNKPNINVLHYLIEVSKINEIEIIRDIDFEKKLKSSLAGSSDEKDIYKESGYISFNKNSDYLGLGYLIKDKTDEEIEDIIKKKNLLEEGNRSTIILKFWNTNDINKLNKLRLAFKHLVALNGGKILEDLF